MARTNVSLGDNTENGMHSDKEMLCRSHETGSGGAANLLPQIQRYNASRLRADTEARFLRHFAEARTFAPFTIPAVVSHAIHAGKESSVPTLLDSNELARDVRRKERFSGER